MSKKVVCPVCELLVGDESKCPRCDWVMESGYILGPMTPQIKAEEERKLEEARNEWRRKQEIDEIIKRANQVGNELKEINEKLEHEITLKRIGSIDSLLQRIDKKNDENRKSIERLKEEKDDMMKTLDSIKKAVDNLEKTKRQG